MVLLARSEALLEKYGAQTHFNVGKYLVGLDKCNYATSNVECVVAPDNFVFAKLSGDELGRVPRDSIEEIAFDDKSQIAQRLTATRMVALGVFALAAPKKKKYQEWCVAIRWIDAKGLRRSTVFEFKRLHKALDLSQRLAPMVLWIDEIEKAFASAGTSGEADAGLSQRLLATLLTWMQDRQGGVFLAATSNNISALPPEMLRKGRFDEIFFVDLPSADSRAALFVLHLRKRGRDPASFDVTKLATASEGFSGAEIEQAIAAGLYTAFASQAQLSTNILLTEIHNTKPLSVTRAEEIQEVREWAKSRTVAAD